MQTQMLSQRTSVLNKTAYYCMHCDYTRTHFLAWLINLTKSIVKPYHQKYVDMESDIIPKVSFEMEREPKTICVSSNLLLPAKTTIVNLIEAALAPNRKTIVYKQFLNCFQTFMHRNSINESRTSLKGK